MESILRGNGIYSIGQAADLRKSRGFSYEYNYGGRGLLAKKEQQFGKVRRIKKEKL